MTGSRVLCTRVLSGISDLSPQALALAYGSPGTSSHVYIYNKPGDYFLQYRDELPQFVESLFNTPIDPSLMHKVTSVLHGLRSTKARMAHSIRSELLKRYTVLYYGSLPNLLTVHASQRKNMAFTNRLGLTGKAFDDLMLTRVPVASVLKSQGMSRSDMTCRNIDNIYDSQAVVQLKPYGSERFTGRNFSFPQGAGSISSYGFASRRAIHRKLRLIKTVHLTSILLLTNQGYLRSLSNYIEAIGQTLKVPQLNPSTGH